MRSSLIVLFALVAFVGRVHGLHVWGKCVSLPGSRCPETTDPGSLDKTTTDSWNVEVGLPVHTASSTASTADPAAIGQKPGPNPSAVKTTTRRDMNVNIGPDTTSVTSPSSSTTTETESPSTTAESTIASTTVPIETSTTTPIPSSGTTKGGEIVIPMDSVPPTTQGTTRGEVIIPGQGDTETSTSATSSPTPPSTTTSEASSKTPGTTTPAPHPPPTVWTPLAPPEIPLPMGPEETERPEVTDPSNRVVSRAPQKPDGEEKKEEGGTNLTGLWVALGVVLVLAIIGGVVAGVIIRKKRMQKKKKAGESKKTDPELGGISALDPIGGGGEIAGSLPPVPVAVRRPKSRGRKPNDEKRWTPVKQMEAGRIVKDKFAFEGRLNFDATGNHGPLVHATADQKSHSLRDVIFADEMNKVYDMGSEIEHVVLSGEHDKPKEEEEKPTEKKKEAVKEKPKTEKSAPPGDPKSQTKPPPPK